MSVSHAVYTNRCAASAANAPVLRAGPPCKGTVNQSASPPGRAAQHHDFIAARRPDRVERGAQIGANLPRLSTAAFDHEDACRPGQQVRTFAPLPIGDPVSVGREARTAAARRQQHRVTAQRRHDINASAGALAAEGHARAVGGDRRIAVVRVVRRQANRLAPAHLLRPDIQIARLAAVAGKSQQVAVSRERRIVVQPTRIGDLPQHLNRCRGVGRPQPPPGRAGRKQRGAGRQRDAGQRDRLRVAGTATSRSVKAEASSSFTSSMDCQRSSRFFRRQ